MKTEVFQEPIPVYMCLVNASSYILNDYSTVFLSKQHGQLAYLLPSAWHIPLLKPVTVNHLRYNQNGLTSNVRTFFFPLK